MIFPAGFFFGGFSPTHPSVGRPDTQRLLIYIHGNIPCAGSLTRLGKFISYKGITAKIKLT